MYYYYHYSSPIGEITIASSEQNIIGLWIHSQKFYMDVLTGQTIKEQETDTIKLAKNWLDRYFRQENPPADTLPIEFIGTDFQKAVWKLLVEIPYGEVIPYGKLAQKIAAQRGIKTMSAQAIGNAVGRNPISIIVPCHRVVGTNGNLTGYAGGLETKTKLLTLEGVDISKLVASKQQSMR